MWKQVQTSSWVKRINLAKILGITVIKFDDTIKPYNKNLYLSEMLKGEAWHFCTNGTKHKNCFQKRFLDIPHKNLEVNCCWTVIPISFQMNHPFLGVPMEE